MSLEDVFRNDLVVQDSSGMPLESAAGLHCQREEYHTAEEAGFPDSSIVGTLGALPHFIPSLQLLAPCTWLVP